MLHIYIYDISRLRVKLHQIVVMPVVLYGCETWSVTWREESRLRGFKNSVLREILGPKRGR